MNILQICHKVPFPPKDGGCIAINNLTEGLIEAGHYVKVLAINTPKHNTPLESLPEEYRKKTHIESVFIDTSVRAGAAFLNLFGSSSYNIDRFHSPKMEEKLIQILKQEQFEIIQLESLFVVPYLKAIRKYSKAVVVLRSHNVEYQIWEKLASQSNNLFLKPYLQLLAKRLRQYETKHLNSYDGIASITAEDADEFRHLGCKLKIETIPFGLDPEKYPASPPETVEMALFHLGAMDWKPNQEAVQWFLEHVWPEIYEKYPKLKLYLAGRNMSAFTPKSSKNVEIAGEVKDIIPFMQSKSIMIVPLQSGSGMRIKIIEGMALGKTVISTKIGAQGINYEAGRNILIAETPSEFIQTIGKCMANTSMLEGIGKNARELVSTYYDNKIICERLLGFYNDLLKKK